MTTFMTVPTEARATVSASCYTTNVSARTVVTGRESLSTSRQPAAKVPADQIYYWMRSWQVNEQIALAEIERGEAVEFDDAHAALSWLLADDE